MEAEYDVFISHAGEDKETLAVPIYDCLQRRGIKAFLDREELRTGNKAAGAMLGAVDGSAIGLCILSPEYGAKNWPMLELERFLQNIEQAKSESAPEKVREPMLIPIFYRLGVNDCKDRLLFSKYKELLQRTDLVDRLTSGDASLKEILDNLKELSKRTGIENKAGATNEDTDFMRMKRERLIETICGEVSKALRDLQNKRASRRATSTEEHQDDDVFQAEFYVPENAAEVILDFSSVLKSSEKLTPEAEVMRKVLCRDEKKEQNRVVVIKGIGGVGKSCTLRGLGQEKEVQRRFPGGVYFISLGKDATVNTLIGELLKVLSLSGGRKLAQKLMQEKDLDVILAKVGKWMKGKRILVLVDDLWDRKLLGASIISRFIGMIGRESGSMVVVTSRFSSVGSMGTMVEIKPREPTSEEARSILLGYACLSEAEVEHWNLEKSLEELLQIGGGLPVCLAAMGRGISELMQQCDGDKGLALRRYLEVISKKREDLVEMGVDGYGGLQTTLSASLEVLEESRKLGEKSCCKWSYAELHRSLCVLQKPAVAPISVVCRLWGVEKEEEGWMMVKRFSDVGLVSMEVSSEDMMDRVRLHDLIHDFAVVCADFEKESGVWHRRLLEGYLNTGDVDGVEKKVREWWKVGDDYMLRMLSWHLVSGERVDELVSILLRYEWTELRGKRGGIVALKEDFSRCLTGLEGNRDLAKEKEVIREALCAIRDALLESWGYIQGNWHEIGFQMWGRLGGEERWGVCQYLTSIDEYLEGPWLKPLKQTWADKSENGFDGELVFNSWVTCITPIRGSVYAAGVGSEVFVVDIDNKEVMYRFGGHAGDVREVVVKNESGTAVSCSVDGTVIHWNVESGEEMERVVLEGLQKGEEFSECLNCAAIDANATFIFIYRIGDEKVNVWDVNTGELLGSAKLKCSTAREHYRRVHWNEASKNGKYVACATCCGVQVWDVSTKTQFREVINGKDKEVQCVAFHPSEEIVASGGFERIRVWDICSGTAYEIDCSDPSWIGSIAFDGRGQRIAAAFDSGVVSVWDVETQSVIYQYSDGSGVSTYGVQFGVHRNVLLHCCSDSTIRVLKLDNSFDCAYEDSDSPRKWIRCIGISPDRSFYVSGYWDGTVVIWDSNAQEPRGDVLEHEEEVLCIAISSDSRLIGTGAKDGNVRIWDSSTCEPKGEPLRGHSSDVYSIAFSPDNRFVVSCSWKEVRIWSIGEGKQIGKVVASVYNPRSSMIVSGIIEVGKAIGRMCRGEGFLDAWTWRPYYRFGAVAVTPDGKRVISSWGDVWHGRMWMWEMETGKFVCEESIPPFSADRIKFSENNCVTAYCKFDMPLYWYLDEEKGMVRIDDDENQENVSYYDGERYRGHCDEIACTHEGRYLIWQADGRRLGTLPVRAYDDSWVYDSSREVIVIGGDDGNVYFYKLMK